GNAGPGRGFFPAGAGALFLFARGQGAGRSQLFPQQAGAVGGQQPLQIPDQDALFDALVGVAHQYPVGRAVNVLTAGGDVLVLADGLLGALERLVGAQRQAAAVVHQRVARNAGAAVVGPAEPAVNDDDLAAALDRAFALDRPHRHLAVDDVAALAGQAELPQDAVSGPGALDMAVIGVFHLGVGGFVGNVQPLKGGHGAAAED